jgi:hypothetical protein
VQVSAGTINLTAKDGLELFLLRLTLVNIVAVVEELLDAKHVAMVGHSHAAHSVTDGLIDQFRNGSLSIKDTVLCVYVQMYEIFHSSLICGKGRQFHCKFLPFHFFYITLQRN